MKIEITEKVTKEVKYLEANCDIRYWEDATIDGVEDTDGTLTPCRKGEMWNPIINVDTGKIINWKQGVEADIHFKVCDAGTYKLLDDENNLIKEIDGYVPKIMCPEENGYGDYVIMKIRKDGQIANWNPSFEEWENSEDD